MEIKPPVPISVDHLKFRVDDIEYYLHSSEALVSGKEYPPKLFVTPDGDKIVFRQASRDEADILLKPLKQIIDMQFDKDLYHLVAARTYAEILAWKQHRYKDEYVIVGVDVTGDEAELVGIWNARMWDENLTISLHSITFRRKRRVGLTGYIAKMEHAFDYLGAKEWWATFESPFGFRMGFYLRHLTKPYPQYQHELGGSIVFYVTKDIWDSILKPKFKAYLGERPVPEDLLEKSKKLIPPKKLEIEL
ncbi:MAG: hypothetical protein GSR85_02590 [Desulfurococcales archaeon]|nr:hypothetical protein [Desulfurococcales archaeon]